MSRNRVAYIDDDLLSQKFVSNKLDSEFEVDTTAFSSNVEALRYINNTSSVNIVILSIKDNNESFKNFLENLANIHREFLVILLVDNPESVEYIPKLKGVTFEVVQYNNVAEIEKVFQHFGILKNSTIDDKYDKLSVDEISRFDSFAFDIFIRINERKYIKVINKSDSFGAITLKKYIDKGLQYVFVERSNYSMYINQVYEDVTSFYEYDCISSSLKLDGQLQSIDFVYRSLQGIGLSQKSIEIANKTMNIVLSDFKKNKSLWKLLTEKLNDSNYLTQHSLSLSYLTSTVAHELGWNTRSTLEKLVMASFLHDIGLNNHELAIINSFDSEDFLMLNQDEVDDVTEHPMRSLELLEGVMELPPNLESLILEHHERPDGKGFPRKKRSGRISPMSCLFILCEVFWNKISRDEKNMLNRKAILRQMSKEYDQGNFRKPLEALIRVFGK
ncbi:MAG: hypothetical protein BM556_05505 [Bacteriovorax sp. MedPE-SWde]|nr:MAG: hypothetical protein BM556_05505 [Bacteriovorax sp. MedPE-SWde]